MVYIYLVLVMLSNVFKIEILKMRSFQKTFLWSSIQSFFIVIEIFNFGLKKGNCFRLIVNF
ncbi:MAG: hypothetical protein EAZ58_11775 [Flavobacterium sp.]|nr:MAG: hypothetical protein EAZ58_11775 [Flavobacterium sp.]